MKPILPVLLVDGYKVGHVFQYPHDTEFVYSNLTARRSYQQRQGGEQANGVVFFGLQYFVREYLMDQFNNGFFARPVQLRLICVSRTVCSPRVRRWRTSARSTVRTPHNGNRRMAVGNAPMHLRVCRSL